MREASRDKATQLEEGGRKDNRDRRQPSFGTVRGVAIRSDCLDALDRALAHSLNDDHSQTVWLGDAVCISHRDTQWPHLGLTRFGNPDTAYRSCLVREVHGLNHLKAFFGAEFGHPADARRVLSAV